MEIQAKTPAVQSTTASVTAATGNGNAPGAEGQAGFSTTLNSMITGDAVQDSTGTAAAPSGLSALIQSLTPILFAAPAADAKAGQLTEGQIDALTQLLRDPEQAEMLLDNPELQAWLSQLQALMVTQLPNLTPETSDEQTTSSESFEGGTEGEISTLNTLLFVPIRSEERQKNPDSNQPVSKDASQPIVSQNQAVQLLKQLKDMVQNGMSDPELKQVLKDLPAVLVSAAAQSGQVHKFTDAIQAQTQALQQATTSTYIPEAEVADSVQAIPVKVQSNELHKSSGVMQRQAQALSQAIASTDIPAADDADLVQVVTAKVHQLEILAAKTIQPNIIIESEASIEAPLFEPLMQTELSDLDGQPITVQEYLKQAPAAHSVKVPVLQMPAAAFADDMAQFVVSSFMIESSVEGFTEAKISLYPQHLGHVEVKLTMQNGQLIAQFVADSLIGKEMLENQLAHLRTTLQNQGIQVEKLEVSHSQGFQSGMFQEGRQQQQSQQPSKQPKSPGSRVASVDDLIGVEGTEEASSRSNIRNGSIDVSA